MEIDKDRAILALLGIIERLEGYIEPDDLGIYKSEYHRLMGKVAGIRLMLQWAGITEAPED